MTDVVESFEIASRVERAADGRFLARVPDGWQQGRGAFGGLAIGIAVRAMEACEAERPLRALTAELPGPLLPGEAEVHVRELRRGTGMTTLEATVVQDAEVRVRASGVFGRARVEGTFVGERLSDLGDWRAVPPLALGALPPPFARFFEYRLASPAPFSGGPSAFVEGWTRPLAELPRWGAAEVVAMADAYWPAIFTTLSAPRPMATVTFTLQLTSRAHALDPSAPLFYRARVLGGDDGFLCELRTLHTAAGELVAINPQTFVIIK